MPVVLVEEDGLFVVGWSLETLAFAGSRSTGVVVILLWSLSPALQPVMLSPVPGPSETTDLDPVTALVPATAPVPPAPAPTPAPAPATATAAPTAAASAELTGCIAEEGEAVVDGDDKAAAEVLGGGGCPPGGRRRRPLGNMTTRMDSGRLISVSRSSSNRVPWRSRMTVWLWRRLWLLREEGM